ncbi:MAG: hypothetical protein KA754_04480 [Corallincola sp.]|nr:hypothetical protein [Corallincola sp.]
MRAFITCLALLFSSLAVAVDSSVPQLYLRGSFNGWTTNQPMYLTSNNTWEATVNASANSEFKFDVSGDWSENYGDGIAGRNGGNIRITQGGYTPCVTTTSPAAIACWSPPLSTCPSQAIPNGRSPACQ